MAGKCCFAIRALVRVGLTGMYTTLVHTQVTGLTKYLVAIPTFVPFLLLSVHAALMAFELCRSNKPPPTVRHVAPKRFFSGMSLGVSVQTPFVRKRRRTK